MQTTLIITAAIIASIAILYIVLNEVADQMPGNSHVGKVNIEQFQSLAQKFRVQRCEIQRFSDTAAFKYPATITQPNDYK
jgi:hypothetical protein